MEKVSFPLNLCRIQYFIGKCEKNDEFCEIEGLVADSSEVFSQIRKRKQWKYDHNDYCMLHVVSQNSFSFMYRIYDFKMKSVQSIYAIETTSFH